MSNTRDAIINSLGEFKLDLLGVVNLFGGDIALSAIHYCVLERRRTFWSAYLSPGSFTVATKLLKRTDNPLAASLSPGQRDECRDIVGLLEAGKYSYIGMLSGTRAKVGNAIGEAVLNTAQKRNKPRVKGAKDSARITKVDVVSVRLDPDADKDGKKLIRSYESLPRWYDILFPIITIVMLVFVSWLGDVVGALMVIIGAASNMLLLGAACASGCTYMPGKPFHGSPDGNAVVTTDLSPNQLWVVLGKEDAVQRLVQRPVIVELNTFWSAVNFVAGLEVYAYTAFSIIALPFVSAPVQLVLGALYFLGMFANITYARRDGDALLSKIAEKDMGLKYNESWQFPNRTSAVAYCVLRCKSNSNNLDGLLPNNTPLWIQWRNLLTYFTEPQALKCDIEKTKELLKQWQEKPEIEEIKNSESKALWDRLISDLMLAKEAYLEESSPDIT